jgi:hypothetical protein
MQTNSLTQRRQAPRLEAQIFWLPEPSAFNRTLQSQAAGFAYQVARRGVLAPQFTTGRQS